MNDILGYNMNSFNQFLSELNESQYRAATFEKKHCMVLAGAGCGKTKTIIGRAIYLISQGIPANRIQILSFTRKSAYEIYERVRSSVGKEAVRGLKTSTFHTWCLSIIRANAKLFGKEKFIILDRDDQLQLFRLYRGKHSKGSFPSTEQINELYSYTRNTKSRLSKNFEKFLPEFVNQEKKIVQIMKMYEQKKNENQYVDYDDILDLVSEAINQYPEVAEYIGNQYDYILVDEMQDTNPLQWSLLEPLAQYTTLFCVGDDAQSIYGFRGADFNNVHCFKNRLSDSEVLRLEDNYRSTQEILDLSNWLLAKSSVNYNKHLKAVRGQGKIPQLHDFDNEWEEGRYIAEQIENNKNEGKKYSDHLILVRSSLKSRAIETALIQRDIPYKFMGGLKIMESAHVKDVLSLLRIAVNNKDEIGWMRYLLIWPGIGEVNASAITEQVVNEASVPNAILKLYDLRNNYKSNDTIVSTIELIAENVLEATKAVSLAIECLSGVLAERYKGAHWEKRKKDFEYLIKISAKFPSLIDFIDSCIIDPMGAADITLNNMDDIVTISTIHTAKGTESDVCFVVNVSVGSYPNTRCIDSIDELEEERRLLYVALTRAKNELVLTRLSKASFAFDVQKNNKILDAYFLNECPSSLVNQISHKNVEYLPEPLKRGKPLNLKIGIDFS